MVAGIARAAAWVLVCVLMMFTGADAWAQVGSLKAELTTRDGAIINDTDVPVTLVVDFQIDSGISKIERPEPRYFLRPRSRLEISKWRPERVAFSLENADGVSRAANNQLWQAEPDKDGNMIIRVGTSMLPRSSGMLVAHNISPGKVSLVPILFEWPDGSVTYPVKDSGWQLEPGSLSGLLSPSTGSEKPPELAGMKYWLVHDGRKALFHTRYTGGKFLTIEITPELLKSTKFANLEGRSDEIRPHPSIPGGRLFVSNRSKGTVSVRLNSVIEADGQTRNFGSSDLVFEPGEMSELSTAGKPARIRKVDFSIVTSEGTSDWSAEYFGGAVLPVVIDDALISRHSEKIAENKAEAERQLAARKRLEADQQAAAERAKAKREQILAAKRRQSDAQELIGGIIALAFLAAIVHESFNLGGGGGGDECPCQHCQGSGGEIYYIHPGDTHAPSDLSRPEPRRRDCQWCQGSGHRCD